MNTTYVFDQGGGSTGLVCVSATLAVNRILPFDEGMLDFFGGVDGLKCNRWDNSSVSACG